MVTEAHTYHRGPTMGVLYDPLGVTRSAGSIAEKAACIACAPSGRGSYEAA